MIRIIHSISAIVYALCTQDGGIISGAADFIIAGGEDTTIGRVVITFAILEERSFCGLIPLSRVAKDSMKRVTTVKVEDAELPFAVGLADILV